MLQAREDVLMADEEHLNHDKLAVLMMTQSEPEANIVKGILEGAGIHCALLTQILHNVYPFTVDGLATIQIRVLDSQLEAAQALLRDYESNAEIGIDEGSEDNVES
jgi:hypothetical protein